MTLCDFATFFLAVFCALSASYPWSKNGNAKNLLKGFSSAFPVYLPQGNYATTGGRNLCSGNSNGKVVGYGKGMHKINSPASAIA